MIHGSSTTSPESFTVSIPGSSALSSRSSISHRVKPEQSQSTGKKLSDSQASNLSYRVRRSRQTWQEYLAERQTKFSLRLIAVLGLAHQIPALQPFTNKLIHIQYYDPVTEKARIGINDVFIVLTWIVLLIFIRATLMNYVFIPFARNVTGMKSKKKQVRFAEQGWSMFYYFMAWVLGMYLLAESDYAFSIQHVWIGWPHYQMSRTMKSYYLIQLACWLSQIYVLNVEEKRKDYVQMFAHHIVTCLLVTGSYYYYYTRIGHVILVLMDVVDVLLSTAKMLKYSGFSNICDVMFGIFLVGWISLRHVFFNYCTWSAMTDAFQLIDKKCYYDENGELVRCFTSQVHWTLVSMLVVLQVITLIWLWYILRVVVKILKGGSAEDNRSDDEDDEDDDESDSDKSS
ncbi:sphingosine N-acyltransferase LAG1 [Sugiyamaella lignohabitans]|uniref:Sphingosine N-acyltransferase LAG1 n=1 Tax=Sugiyamaella lignohabitans TaxID=796027 RepID=A0A167CI24_9ASCO|nr:sphingosine N-acyltransferase LAG1 [Sugiyamaella lignohabitans]ANB11729.1 sphingosine N-acyltransferase LAG1 [Sugiyamaella lignohabitans]